MTWERDQAQHQRYRSLQRIVDLMVNLGMMRDGYYYSWRLVDLFYKGSRQWKEIITN
jgi:hypothetical protein